jgi:hypothetical protein
MKQLRIAAVGLATVWTAVAQKGDLTTFGVTVVNMYALRGDVYLIKEIDSLPKFEKLKRVGTVYATALNIPPREFQEGFPGITDRFEWFAIDYKGRFWIEKPGRYEFSLTSDDGSKLYIDDKVVIDNDGVHAPRTVVDSVNLSEGLHRIRVSYFQGPRLNIALVLSVAGPGEKWRIFSTDEFRPHSDPEDGKIR